MKVAEKNVIAMNARMERVYMSQRLEDGAAEHDARGLVLAIGLCMACWAVLGYFLLT